MRTIDLARQVGLSAQQVRNYEAMGLLPVAERDASGYRRYTPRHLDALLTVRAMIAARYHATSIEEAMRAAHVGDADTVLALVDARYAALDRERRQVELTLEAIRTLQVGPSSRPGSHRPHGLTIGEAAAAIGVQPSALRFWESEKLLCPAREAHNGYRRYDRHEMKRLEVVVLLRRANYRFDAIRSVLDELSRGKPESSLRAVEQRRAEIAATSRACARATVALMNYVAETP